MQKSLFLFLGVLAGCGYVPPLVDVSPPEDSGLVAVRGYPTDAGPCQVIGENDLTNTYLDDSAILVGCPSGDQRAIDARATEGAVIHGLEGQWLLMSVPLRDESLPDPAPLPEDT